MRLMPLTSFALGLSLLWSGGAAAHDYKLGDIEIGHPWARVTTSKTGVAYLTLNNEGKSADALVGVSADVSDKVQIHSMEMDGTIMRMRKLDQIALEPGRSVSLAPGGTHIMLIGLKAPLTDKSAFPLTLTFAKAGKIEVSVHVQAKDEPAEAAGTMPDKMGDMPGMNMGDKNMGDMAH